MEEGSSLGEIKSLHDDDDDDDDNNVGNIIFSAPNT